MTDNKQTFGESNPIELTEEMSVGFKHDKDYMLKLLHRTLSVNWEHDPDIQLKIEKLSHILAAGRWERSRRHGACHTSW